jgi:hypothetical protein
MIERGTLVICDLCLIDELMREPAAISAPIPTDSGWLVETLEGFPDVHVCPRHADPERRRRVADPWHWTCEACQRSTSDDQPPDSWRSTTLCSDCRRQAVD